MAPGRKTNSTRCNFHVSQAQDLDNTYQFDHESDYESGLLDYEEQYEIDENELNLRQPETTDAGICAQDGKGRLVSKKKRAEAAEQQGTVKINAHESPEALMWSERKNGVSIPDQWTKIDEEEAPLPKNLVPKGFLKYPEDPQRGIDWEKADDTAYLRQVIRSLARKLEDCRSDLEEEERKRIKAEWERNMAQKKAKRYWSYSIHVTETVALPIHRAQQAKDAKLEKHRKAVAKREKAVESERILQQNEQAEFEKTMELFRAEVVEEAKNIKTLRKELLDNDAIKSRLRQDIMSEVETEMMEKRSSWHIAQNKKCQELNNEKREFQLERDTWKEEKDQAISKVIKDEWISQGYEKGLSEGKMFKSKEQYLLGYHYGARNANKKTAKQNLQERYNDGLKDGLKAGKEEMSKQAEQTLKTFKDQTSDFIHRLLKLRVREVEDKLAEKFRVWMRERETAIRLNSRAYGLYEGAVNQIRRQNNVEGSEQEEDALTNVIAVTMAEQIVTATATGSGKKICWHNTRVPNSPLYMQSKEMLKSSFYKALMPKLTEQLHKATKRVELAKQEQEKQKQAHAARVEAEWAARDATTQQDEGEFVPVESGVPAPYPRRLPVIVEEPLENEEAQEMSDKEMMAAFLKNIRDQ